MERLAAIFGDAEPDAFVFGDGTIRPREADLLREHLESAGLPTKIDGKDVTFHALRRTFSTILEAADVSGDLIDRMLGHAPQSTRGRHYSKPSVEAMARAVLNVVLDDPGEKGGGSSGAGNGGEAIEFTGDYAETPPVALDCPSLLSQDPIHECVDDADGLIRSTPGENRTCDQRFRKPLLYPLSYGGKLL